MIVSLNVNCRYQSFAKLIVFFILNLGLGQKRTNKILCSYYTYYYKLIHVAAIICNHIKQLMMCTHLLLAAVFCLDIGKRTKHCKMWENNLILNLCP